MNEKTENPNDSSKNFSRKRRELSPQEEKWKNQALWFCGIFLTLFIGEINLLSDILEYQ